MVKETNGANGIDYLYGDDLISQDRNGAESFYLYDGSGSTRALTDSTGAITDTYSYEAFGSVLNQTGTTENNYLFTGEQYDPGQGNYYLRNRYYDPNSGRFTQMDTWMGSNSDPVTLHKYLYANVDPVNNIDPSGNFSIGSVMSAVNVVSHLTTIANTVSFARSVASGEEELTAKDIGFLILENMVSRKAAKFLKRTLGGCNSFSTGTLVYTLNGLMQIEIVSIGDHVWSYNELEKENELKEVVHLISNESVYHLSVLSR